MAMNRHLRDTVLINCLLQRNEHAYQKGKSCQTTLHCLVGKTTLQKEIALGVLLDKEGAFVNTSTHFIVSKLASRAEEHCLEMMQRALTIVERWSDEEGLAGNCSKTVIIAITSMRILEITQPVLCGDQIQPSGIHNQLISDYIDDVIRPMMVCGSLVWWLKVQPVAAAKKPVKWIVVGVLGDEGRQERLCLTECQQPFQVDIVEREEWSKVEPVYMEKALAWYTDRSMTPEVTGAGV
ncbi:hypothetical protein J6590_082473 [Homalodisca vitripennis]|nr:hypothetical protein J6590_082473 [Homalodisca vitripennis]